MNNWYHYWPMWLTGDEETGVMARVSDTKSACKGLQALLARACHRDLATQFWRFKWYQHGKAGSTIESSITALGQVRTQLQDKICFVCLKWKDGTSILSSPRKALSESMIPDDQNGTELQILKQNSTRSFKDRTGIDFRFKPHVRQVPEI